MPDPQLTGFQRFKANLAKAVAWVGNNLSLILIIAAALGWILYKRKALQVDVLALKIKSLLLEKELAKLEERKKKDEEAFKSELDRYNDLKRQSAEYAKRLGIL